MVRVIRVTAALIFNESEPAMRCQLEAMNVGFMGLLTAYWRRSAEPECHNEQGDRS